MKPKHKEIKTTPQFKAATKPALPPPPPAKKPPLSPKPGPEENRPRCGDRENMTEAMKIRTDIRLLVNEDADKVLTIPLWKLRLAHGALFGAALEGVPLLPPVE